MVIHARREVLGQHQRADHLGVEREPDGVPVEVSETAAGTRRRRRDDMVDCAEPLGDGGDRRLVGEVDHLGGDVALPLVLGGECSRVAVGDYDRRPCVAGGEGEGAGNAAPTTDDEDGLVLEWSVHGTVLCRNLRMWPAASWRWLSRRKWPPSSRWTWASGASSV